MCCYLGTRKSNGFSRSAGLNDTRSPSRRYSLDKGGANKAGTTYAFSSGSLTDSGNGLGTAGVFIEGQRITVQGAASGNRTYIMGTVAAGSIALTPAPADASAGPTVLLRTVQ